jgi:7,8-dihydropterin-6-yl-methyl-4-(beta-D-ribofuranosyl)aminobenzene 5'-phosphate synthase
MATTLTVLVENTVPGKADGLMGEHGFALFLERPDARILFDTGASGTALLHNASRLGVDVRATDAIVLSHGHQDHTGGLVAVLRAIGKSLPVYGHPGIFADRYGKRTDRVTYAGLPFKREALEGLGAAFDLSADFRLIAPGIHATGEVARQNAFETGDASLFVKQGEGTARDPFSDDQSLVVETTEGLALILGCCHAGLINTIQHVQRRLPDRPIRVVVGGTHLGFAPKEQLEQTVRLLKDLDIQRVGCSHCTGLPAGAYLSRELGSRVEFCNVGYALTLP